MMYEKLWLEAPEILVGLIVRVARWCLYRFFDFLYRWRVVCIIFGYEGELIYSIYAVRYYFYRYLEVILSITLALSIFSIYTIYRNF